MRSRAALFLGSTAATAGLVNAAVLLAALTVSAPCLNTPCAAATAVNVRVAADTDDAEEWSATGSMYLDSTDLELAVDGTRSDTVGMRFTSVAIPQGATISNAYIQFKTDESSSGACALIIRGQATDNAAGFTSAAYSITSRATTTANVAWSPPNWSTVGEAGSAQRTPNISSVLQEIVSRPGWSHGNSLVIIVTGSGTRKAESYLGDPAGAPLLHVEFTYNSPVGHWKLNQTSGVTALDSSVFAKHGTVSGTTSWSTRCSGTGVFDFNGSSHYISVPSSSNLQPFYGFSIAAWIRGDSWSSGTDVDTILRKGEDNPNNYALAISDGRVELLLDGNDGSGIRSNTVLSTGAWYHVAATWDGVTARIYINGVLDRSVFSPAFLGTDTRPLYIGGRSGTDYFDGMIHGIMLYNRALSAAELGSLAGLAGHWKFAEGTGTSAADSSAAGNNAALSGGATWTTDCAGNNNALLTNGSGGIAQTASAFTPPDEGTVAFWMRSNGAPPALGRIFGVGGDWEARQMTNGTLVFDLCGEGGGHFETTVPLDVVGQWYHVVATFDSATDAYAIYIDGQLHKTGTNSNAMTQQPAAVLSFGARTGSTQYWQGALRDFRVYSRRLCPSEIAELYGLVGHWRLDETSGTAAADSSGLGQGGTLSGTVSWTTGAVDGAHQFNYADGTDYITIVNSTLLDNVQENSYSLAAWFKPLSTPPGTGSANDAHYAILAKAGYHTALFYSNSRTLEFSHVLTGNQSIGSGTWPVTYPTGLFYHVTGVVDRPGGTIKIYVDGELKNTGSFTAGTAAREYGSEPWRIGIANPFYSTWGWGAHGIIDDVRIYNRTLCPAEIQTLHDLGTGAFGGVKIIKWVEIQ